MSVWTIWEAAYRQMELSTEGDPMEIGFANGYNLSRIFPNYEKFWRFHVAPATNRPVDLDHRPTAAKEVCVIMTLSYSILNDLFDATLAMAELRRGVYGDRYKNFKDAVKSAGDGLQKFTDFQRSIENDLARALHRTIQVWSHEEWKTTWEPRREKIINYRNYLTHISSAPRILLVPSPGGGEVPHVLRRDFVVLGQYPTWNEQSELYASNPERFGTFMEIYDELYAETAGWLNDAYAKVIESMDPLLPEPSYHFLWGWDQSRYGSGSGPPR